MRINENALKFTGRTSIADREGRLQYKSPRENYRQRWFKLKGNLLFYFRTNDKGQQSEPEPIGVLLLERCEVKLEPLSDRPFVFSLNLEGEGGRAHYFSGQTQQQCENWVTSITKASYTLLKAELMHLRLKLQQHTGKDPVEDLYRKLNTEITPQSSHTVARVPTRRAPSPPHTNSTFYAKDSPGGVHLSLNMAQYTTTPGKVETWTKVEPPTKPSALNEHGNGANNKCGWELFE